MATAQITGWVSVDGLDHRCQELAVAFVRGALIGHARKAASAMRRETGIDMRIESVSVYAVIGSDVDGIQVQAQIDGLTEMQHGILGATLESLDACTEFLMALVGDVDSRNKTWVAEGFLTPDLEALEQDLGDLLAQAQSGDDA